MTSNNIITSTSEPIKKTALNLSLFQGRTVAKLVMASILTVFSVAGLATLGVIIGLRSQPRYPVANPDNYQTFKGEPITFYPLDNDLSEEGVLSSGSSNDLRILYAQGSTYGSITYNKFSMTYIPQDRWAGVDNFSYTIGNGKYPSSSKISVETLNRPPEPQPDFISISKNNLYAFDPLVNDKDPDNDPLWVSDVNFNSSELKSVTIGSLLKIEPRYNFVGNTWIYYNVTDHNDTSSSIISVNVYNDPPIANRDYLNAYINTESNIPVLINDVDPNHDRLEIVSISGIPEYGDVSISSDKYSLTYIPYWNDINTDILEYTITDGFNLSSSTVTISIINRPPWAQDVIVEIPKSSSGINLLSDDMFGDLDRYSVLKFIPDLSFLEHGNVNFTTSLAIETIDYYNITLDINSYTLIYKPLLSSGIDIIPYSVSDFEYMVNASITVKITNSQPIANDDYFSGSRNQALKFNPLSNDLDPDNDNITLNWIGSSSTGTVNIITNNIIEYIPSFGYIGDVKLSYSIIDNDISDPKISNIGYIHLNIINLNPVAVNDTFKVSKNRVIDLDVLLNDTDPNFDPFEIISPPNNNLFIRYIPRPNATYSETFPYIIWDFDLNATGYVTVNVGNDPPIAKNDYILIPRNHNTSFNVLENDYDPNFDPIYIFNYSVPILGNLYFDSGFTYFNDEFGTFNFTYFISDSDASSSANVDIEIVNTIPIPYPDYYEVHCRSPYANLNVMDNDFDQNLDPLFLISVFPTGTQLSSSITVSSVNVIYVPRGGLGLDTFNYSIFDGYDISSSFVIVNVTNSRPIPQDDTFSLIYWKNSIFLDLLSNDYDQDLDTLSISTVIQPLIGTFNSISGIFNPPSGKINWTLINSTFASKEITFSYSITDRCQQSLDFAHVNLTLYDNRPQGNPDIYYVSSLSNINLHVLNNDNDPDGDDLIISHISSSSFTISSDKKSIIGLVSRSGSIIFTYQISDGQLESNSISVTINIINLAPVCDNVSINMLKSIGHSANASITLVLNCTDPELDTITVISSRVISLNPIGTTNDQLKFTLFENRSGSALVEVNVTDSFTNITTYIEVNVKNNPPVIMPQYFTIYRSSSRQINLLAFTSDPNLDLVTLKSYHSSIINGVNISIDNSGILKILTSNFSTSTFTVNLTVTDLDLDFELTSASTVGISLISYPPQAQNDNFIVSQIQSGMVQLDVLLNDFDNDNDLIEIMGISNIYPPEFPFSLTINSNKIDLTFTTIEYCGPVSFRYTIRSIDGISTANVNVTIINCICYLKLELVFILDSSGSITLDKFNNIVKPSVNYFAQRFNLGPDAVRMAIVSFSDTARIETPTWIVNSTQMTSIISNITYMNSGTCTTCGFQVADNFVATNGVRFGAHVAYLLFTDGFPNKGNPIDPRPLANTINSRKGYRIYALAVGSFTSSSLAYIWGCAWNPAENIGWWKISSFNLTVLQSTFETMASSICDHTWIPVS